MNNNKKAIVCGGGGFIGGHLAKRLKKRFWVRVVDIVDKHEFWNHDEICEYISGDLRDLCVKKVFDMPFDEAYQLAADMGMQNIFYW